LQYSFFYYLIKGLPTITPVINSPTIFSADLLNYILPTIVTRFGYVISLVADRLSGNPSEQGAYLGFPLIIIGMLYFHQRISLPSVEALLISLLLIALLSLGPFLHIAGM
jgi:hypothetical protein